MKEFEKTFVESFAKRFAKHGFDKKRRTYVYRKTNLGNCGVRLGFTKKLYGFDIRAYLSVRFDKVEELVGRFPPNRFWKETSTLDTELGSFIDREIRNWSIKLDDDKELGNVYLEALANIGLPKTNVVSDVGLIMDEIVENIEVFGLPFLEKYCDSLESALLVLSKDDREAFSVCPSINGRAQRAIVIAYLLEDKEAFKQIAGLKESLLKQENNFDLESFVALRSYLQESSKVTLDGPISASPSRR